MMLVYAIALVFSFQFLLHPVTAEFDCEPTNLLSGTCNTELKCIYDEAYEGPTVSCRCKTLVTAISLPSNTLSYELFNKICSTNRARMQQLQVNDAELEWIDDQIFENYPNLKRVNLVGNRMKLNFSEKAEGITELDISFNEIGLLKSSTFNNLRFLKILNMSFNHLEEINVLFLKLHDLEELYLNNNRLSNVRYNDYNYLQRLRVLNLAHNSIASVDSQLKLLNLQELYLNNNKLAILRRYDFRDLPNLRILNLAGNFISVMENNVIANARGNGNLQDSQTEGTPSGHNPQEQHSKSPVAGFFFFTLPQNAQNRNIGGSRFQFANPQNKNYLNFGNNFLHANQQNMKTNFNPFQVFNESILQSQRKLAGDQQNFASYLMGKNYVSGETMIQQPSEESSVSTWTKLRELNIAENRIRHFSDGFFDNLVELRKLNVSHNELTTFDLMKIVGSTKLTVFDIKRNRLKGLNLKLLRDKWSVLKVIDLDLNLVNCDESLDILDYFEGNGIVLKGCVTKRCCGRIFESG